MSSCSIECHPSDKRKKAQMRYNKRFIAEQKKQCVSQHKITILRFVIRKNANMNANYEC
jgi:hypothetical protein